LRTVFADTFYWIALSDPADAGYRYALALEQELVGETIFTTEEVLAEFLTFFATHPWSRARASQTVQGLFRKRKIRVIPQSHTSFLSGLDLYNQRPDKAYSITDCISMETMRREGLIEVLTNDKHFEQEGFYALFRS